MQIFSLSLSLYRACTRAFDSFIWQVFFYLHLCIQYVYKFVRGNEVLCIQSWTNRDETFVHFIYLFIFSLLPCTNPANSPPSNLPLCWFHFCDCSFFSTLVYYIIFLIWFYRKAFLHFLSFFYLFPVRSINVRPEKMNVSIFIYINNKQGAKKRRRKNDVTWLFFVCTINNLKISTMCDCCVCVCVFFAHRFCESRRLDS